MGKVTRPFWWHHNFVHKGLSAPALGLYTCGKTLKNVYKIRFRRDHFETCNIWVKRKGLSVVIKCLSPVGCLPLPGAIYMWKKKHIKKTVKIRLQRDHFETCNLWAKRKGLSVVIKLRPQGLSVRALWLYHKKRKKSDFKEIFFKLATDGQSDKEFLLTSKFCPQMCLKSYFKEIVLKHATNGQSDKGFLLTSTFVPKELSASVLGLYTCIKALKYIPGPCVRWAFTGPLVLWFIKKYSVRLLSKILASNPLVENDVKNWYRNVNNWHHDVKKKTWRHAQESSYIPSCKTFPSPGQVHGNSGRVWKKKKIQWAALVAW